MTRLLISWLWRLVSPPLTPQWDEVLSDAEAEREVSEPRDIGDAVAEWAEWRWHELARFYEEAR